MWISVKGLVGAGHGAPHERTSAPAGSTFQRQGSLRNGDKVGASGHPQSSRIILTSSFGATGFRSHLPPFTRTYIHHRCALALSYSNIHYP